jgi:hypothetical protein
MAFTPVTGASGIMDRNAARHTAAEQFGVHSCAPYLAARFDTVRSPFMACNATRALNAASWFLRFDMFSDLRVPVDPQTSDRSFRHCPISGDELTLAPS